ncbi:DNA polymerase III subunit gamma/tau [Breznakia sp. OttesenSCG-928-G09]|nr:DNA polymerase III subunit gamma/tau [Breznakia sp. OttesenSCG-928-G09]
MAYKALYRTYRPEGFEDMAGQKHIIKTLENAVNNNKIAHAYLFCGPRGTGKTSTAKIFAKAVNCQGEVKPCGMCESCKSVNEGTHPDIIEIDAASNNGVEEVRNLIDKVKYAPIKGKYKVYIIDEVHMMSQGAYNALLKTIEEPPAHVIFIFATTEPYKVLPTIISRCQRFDFAKISPKEIIKRLSFVCDKEGIKYENGVLEIIAELADGGMRDALSILDQCYAYAPENIKQKDVFDIYGILTTQEKIEIFEYIKKKNTAELMNKINQLDQRGVDIKRLTSDLVELLKEKIIYDYTKDETMLVSLTKETVATLSAGLDAKESLEMIDVLMDSYEKYRNASNIISYLEIALLKMMGIVSRETFEETPILRVEKEDREVIDAPKPIFEEKEVVEPVVADEPIEIEEEISESEEIQSEEVKPVEEQEPSQVDEVSSENALFEQSETEPEEDNSYILGETDIEQTDKDYEEEIIETIDQVAEEYVEDKPREFKTLDDSYILQLLVSANKKEKEEDKEQMKGIYDYRLDLDYAKYANLLGSNEIIASGEGFLIMCTNSQALANEINELDKQGEFISFINLLIKKKKKVFAITNVQYERVVDEFRNKQRINALPEPIIVQVNDIEEEKDETMESLNILFGKNIDIKEDE